MESKLGIKETIELLVSFRAEQMTLWNFLLVVSIGFIGVMYTKDTPATPRFKAIITFAFVLFALGNMYFIATNQSFVSVIIGLLAGSSDTAAAQAFTTLKNWTG